MFFQHSKVKFRLLFSQFLAIIPFLIMIFFLIDLWYDTRRTLVIEQNLTQARLLAENINTSVDHAMNISRILADNEIFTFLNQSGNLEDKTRLKQTLKTITGNIPPITNIALFDENGNYIESSLANDSSSNANISDRLYFQKAKDSGNAQIEGPLTGRLSGDNIIIFASPIFIDNQFKGVVSVTISLNQLTDMLSRLLSPEQNHVLVINNKGEIVLDFNNANHDLVTNKDEFLTNEYVRNAFNDKQSIIDNDKIPGIGSGLLLGSVIPVDGDTLNWLIISVDDSNLVFQPIIRTQTFIWLLILVAVVSSLAVLSYFLRKTKIIY